MEEARIIVAESNRETRKIISETLERARHTVVDEAADMVDALQIFGSLVKKELIADILVTDKSLTFGGTEGIKIIKITKELFPHIVTIAFTAEPEGLGEAHYIASKPLLNELCQIISDLPEPDPQG